MIVTCTSCETSFQLDESRVPEQGIRVRCSRCKEAFFLAHPSASQAQAIHGVASEAAVAEAVPGPGTTQDLADPAVAAPADGASPARGGIEADVNPDLNPDLNNEDEHDWEFSVDPDREIEDESVDLDDGMPDLEMGSGLSLEGEVEEDEDIEIDPSVLASVDVDPGGEEESAFGSVDDFSSLMEEGDLQSAVDLEDDAVADVSPDPEDALGVATDVAAEAGSYSSGGIGDDLGDPESWDLLSSQAAAEAESATPIGKINLTTAGACDVVGENGLSVEDAGTAEPWSDELYGAARPGPSRLVVLLGQLGQGLGWALGLGLIAVVLTNGRLPFAGAFVEPAFATTLGPLRADAVRIERIDTARGETLLSISGVLHNPSDASVDLGGPLAISLLTAEGAPIEGAVALAGLELGESDLRELDWNALDTHRVAAIAGLVTHAVEPGFEQRFQAVLPDAWQGASRYRVEVGEWPASTESIVEVPEANALELDELTLEDGVSAEAAEAPSGVDPL